MKPLKLLTGVMGLATGSALIVSSQAQSLPGSVSFNVAGTFQNGVTESQNSVLVFDNDLTDGYVAGMDLHQVPAGLGSYGPPGSAAFQWGSPAVDMPYPHASALWFEPLAINNIAAEQVFSVGYLYYRNGTINTGTGASSVDLMLSFTMLGDGTTISPVYTSDLINTPNIGTPAEQADIVSLANLTTPVSYQDASGNFYFLELAFRVSDDTINNSLSTPSEFRVYEGSVGRAEMIGILTTTPGTLSTIPEPSALLFGALGPALCLRRKRRA